MDGGAPPVVAVVWGPEAGTALKVTLASLAATDYSALTVLVVPSEVDLEVADLARGLLPASFLAEAIAGENYLEGANRASVMVEGATFLLFVVPGYRLQPDALSKLVETALRENAGVATPKVVHDDDRSLLIHVGQSIDSFGTTVERVEFGEFDQGQHDASRDVFVAPAGVTLIRKDLFALLGGFDPTLTEAGSDVDFSWRARLAGARVMTAPEALVMRHGTTEEALESYVEDRELSPEALGSLRRAELHHLLVNDSILRLCKILPPALFLALAEAAVLWGGRHRDRAQVILSSWRWALSNRKTLFARRRVVQATRQSSDRKLKAEQTRGSSRLREFFTRLWHQGLDAARGVEASSLEDAQAAAGFGGAFSDDQGFDELDDLGKRDLHRAKGRHALLSSRRSRLVVWGAIAIWWIYAVRALIAAPIAKVGELGTVPSFSSGFSNWWQGWHPDGVGTTAAHSLASPILSILSIPLFGHSAQALKILLLASWPLFAMGSLRLLKPLASPRARLATLVGAMGVTSVANAVAMGQLSVTLTLTAMPWLLAGLLRIHGLAVAERSSAPSGWHALKLGIGLGALAAFAPSALIAFTLAAIGLSLALWGSGRWQALKLTALAIAIALLLNLPVVLQSLFAGSQGLAIFGSQAASWSMGSPLALLGFGFGPFGHLGLSAGMFIAAAFVLIAGRGPRFAVAIGLLAASVASGAFGLLSASGSLGAFAPSPAVLLAPLSVTLIVMLGLGVATLEEDLVGFSFGWRQATGILAGMLSLLGILPGLSVAGGGHLGLPSIGYGSLGAVSPKSPAGRILWIGNPDVMPGRGWSAMPGVAFTTSELHAARAASLAAAPGAGPATGLGVIVRQVSSRQTVHAGLLLAPYAVRYVAVVTANSPSVGNSTGTSAPTDPRLIPGFDRQQDLSRVPSPEGVALWRIRNAIPIEALRSRQAPAQASPLGPASAMAWTAFAPGALERSTSGSPSAANVLIAVAPSDAVHFSGKGERKAAFGWATQFTKAGGPSSIQLASGASALRNLGLELFALLVLLVMGRRTRAALLASRRRDRERGEG